jgi:DNA-binding transcriptional ArsR family regulator
VRLTQPLNDILSSRAKVALLRAVCLANGPLNGREIARRAGVGAGHASRALGDLAASGVLLCRDQGRVKTYELAHPEAPVVHHLRDLFEAETQRYRDLISGLVSGVPGLVSLILFGSEARSKARPESDTDLLLVVEEKSESLEAQVRDNALRLAQQGSLKFSWVIADLAEVREWETTGNPFWTNVQAEGISLRGKSPERLHRRCQNGATFRRGKAALETLGVSGR